MPLNRKKITTRMGGVFRGMANVVARQRLKASLWEGGGSPTGLTEGEKILEFHLQYVKIYNF